MVEPVANHSVISCENLGKHFVQGDTQVPVLSELNFSVSEGETVAIIGSSGAGKSTLLNLLGGLSQPTTGKVLLKGNDLSQASDKTLAGWRNQYLGFVYQFHHLLNEFTALENVAMPLLIAGHKKKVAFERAAQTLTLVGLGERQSHRPDALSGGERQRVAIARAIVTEPACVLMDEPTGNLDELTSESILSLLLDLNTRLKTSFIIVTHDKSIAKRMQHCYELSQQSLKPVEL